jgi:predicted transcriptional regulator
MPYRDPERPKRFVIQLSTDTHKKLKILAAKFETTMDKLANQFIMERIEEEGGK